MHLNSCTVDPFPKPKGKDILTPLKWNNSEKLGEITDAKAEDGKQAQPALTDLVLNPFQLGDQMHIKTWKPSRSQGQHTP